MPNRQHHSQRSPRPTTATGPGAGSSPSEEQGGILRRLGEVQTRDGLLVLAALVLLCYFPALFGDFVWDDVAFSEETALHSPAGLLSIWFSPADIRNEGHYWPLTYTTFWLEHMIWGLAPFGYHAVNLLLHFANAALIWRLLRRLAVPGAFVIAAIFTVHPLRVESVAWIIERKDLLSGLFYLATVLAYLRFQKAPRPRAYGLALFLFVCGLLSKSVVVTLPVTLLILCWWQTGTVTRKDLLRLMPFVVIAVVITAADYAYYSSRESLDLGYSFLERCLIAARALWFYGIKQLWPGQPIAIYPLWEIRITDFLAWFYLIGALGLVGLLWFGRRRFGNGPLAGALFFAVTLAPVLGFIDYGYMQFSLVADRYQYLAGLGVLAVLIGGIAHGVQQRPNIYQAVALGLATTVVVVFGALTWQQAGIWKTQLTLFNHVIAHNPQAHSAHFNLAAALTKAERFEEALAARRTAVEQQPDSARAQAGLCRDFLNLNRLDEAEKHCRIGQELDARSINSHQNLAEVFRRQQRYDEALASYQTVLNIRPDFALAYAGMSMVLAETERYAESAEAAAQSLSLQPNLMAGRLHLNQGLAEWQAGNTTAAQTHFETALQAESDLQPLFTLASRHIGQNREEEAVQLLQLAEELKPDDPFTYHRIAEVLRQLGRFDEALENYQFALDIQDSYLPATAGMGILMYRQQRYAEAADILRQALSLEFNQLADPGSLYRTLGQALLKLDQVEEAIAQLERAAQLNPSDQLTLENLGAAYFTNQQYEDALDTQRTLVQLAPDNALAHSNMGAVFYHLGRLEEAQRSVQQALALNPNLAIAQIGLQQVQQELQER